MATSDITSPGRISSVLYYILSDAENVTDSCVTIYNKETSKGDKPVLDGVNDPHMGTPDRSWLCKTCHNRKSECDGHCGDISLRYPIKSPIYRDYIFKVLRIICFTCANLIVKAAVKLPREAVFAEYVRLSKTKTKCDHCGAPVVQITRTPSEPNMFYIDKKNPKGITTKVGLLNHDISSIFNRIADETVLKFGRSLTAHPKNTILQNLRIIPNTARPDTRSIGIRTSIPDTTVYIRDIVEINSLLPLTIPETTLITAELRSAYVSLETQCYGMIRGNKTAVGMSAYKQPKSIADRLPGKQGRLRKCMLGKRCRFMVRSVITGDNSIKVDEIGIPISAALIIEHPETVSEANIDRLNIYFKNKDTYPGCSTIRKQSDGKLYSVKNISGYALQIGDIVYRYLITGDYINMNRSPSLTFSSMSCHRVKVLFNSDTIRMNVSSCIAYNADFDGDAMQGYAFCDIMAMNEGIMLNYIGQWCVSYQNSMPMFGAYQDSLIGSAKITRSSVRIHKFKAMMMFSSVGGLQSPVFSKTVYTGRELFSMLLPKINFRGVKPSFYMPQFSKIIKYNDEDITIVIDRGELKSGVLDTGSIGQGTPGSIFQIINNEYDSKTSLRVLFDIHQLTSRFLLWNGFSLGVKDTKISEKAKHAIQINRQRMFERSKEITRLLDDGKLIAPIGMTSVEYYEQKQLNALQPADDFVEPIYADLDLDNNGIAGLIIHKSKGKPTNLININGDIGQPLIDSRRPAENFAWGRSSPYFFRHDSTPKARGYIATSYGEGVGSDVYMFTVSEGRDALIRNALSTCIPGFQTRLAVRCLESIILNNNRSSAKPGSLVQPLYAESGLDQRKLEHVVFPSITISDEKFKEMYYPDINVFDKIYRNEQVKAVLMEEYERVAADRKEFRNLFITMSEFNPGGKIYLGSKYLMPVNINRIVSDAVYNYSTDLKDSKAHPALKRLDPVTAIQKVKDLCDTIGYVFFNAAWETAKKDIPDHIDSSLFMFRVLVRSVLNTKYLVTVGITDPLLDIAITKIKIVYKNALMDYGTAIGVIAAQCVSEPMTQYVLDSKHRAGGGGGSRTRIMDRVKEIFGARVTDKMKNPTMILIPIEKYKLDKQKVQEIANQTEMMKFERFVKTARVFFEEYGNPVHSKFKHETVMIKHFEKYSPNPAPGDLAKWCIRFELSLEEMLINSMKLETIVDVLNCKFPYIYIVYTPDNSHDIIVRCYFRHAAFKLRTAQNVEHIVIGMMHSIRNTVIRGLDGVKYSTVIEITAPVESKDGSIQNEISYGIETIGTNFEGVAGHTDIDILKSQCDSILEFEEIYGIAAARNKLIAEMVNAMGNTDYTHATLYADEMCTPGYVTSLQKIGLQKRETTNVPLRMGFQFPIQTAEEAAVNEYTSDIHGISAPLIMGTSIRVGTRYNEILVCEKFVEEYHKDMMKNIADEL